MRGLPLITLVLVTLFLGPAIIGPGLRGSIYMIGHDAFDPALPHMHIHPFPQQCGPCSPQQQNVAAFRLDFQLNLPSHLSRIEYPKISGILVGASWDGKIWYQPEPAYTWNFESPQQSDYIEGCFGYAGQPLYTFVCALRDGQFETYSGEGRRGKTIPGPPLDRMCAVVGTRCGISCNGTRPLPTLQENCQPDGTMPWNRVVAHDEEDQVFDGVAEKNHHVYSLVVVSTYSTSLSSSALCTFPTHLSLVSPFYC